MIYYFLQINTDQNQNIFENLAISKDELFCNKHQNKYPVIFVSFKDIKRSSYEEAYEDILVLMSNLYTEYAYLLEKDILFEHEKTLFTDILNQRAKQSNLHEAIRQLSLYLTRQFETKPIILIERVRYPIQEAYLKGYYESMIEAMRVYLVCRLRIISLWKSNCDRNH